MQGAEWAHFYMMHVLKYLWIYSCLRHWVNGVPMPLECSSLWPRSPLCKTEMLSSFLVWYKDEKPQRNPWYSNSWWTERKKFMKGSSSHRGQQFSGTCALIGSSIQGTHLTFKPCSSPLVGLKLLLLRGGNCKQALPIGKKMPIKNNTASFSFQTKKLV